MMDIEIIKNIVQTFAEKYNFIQQTDIEKVEKMNDFNAYIQGCYKLAGKKYICINEWSNKTGIECGTIYINVDKDDEGDEEYYGIDQSRIFLINLADFSNEDALIEAIIKECKNYGIFR